MNTPLQDFYNHLSQDNDTTPLVLDPHIIDDWLADELCQSGMLSDTNSTQDQPHNHLPHSPPISPLSSTSTPNPPQYQAITLFPEIQGKNQLILPKTNNTAFPKIAPRPVLVQQPPVKINPTHKQKRPLSDKEQDEIILKRQKNTDAARRSRMKKLVKMEQLEKKVSELENDKQSLTTRVAVLESEKSGLASKSASHEDRIKILEMQLAEAHKALAKP